MLKSNDIEFIQLIPNNESRLLATKFLETLRQHYPHGDLDNCPVNGDVYLQKFPNNFVGIKFVKTKSYIPIFLWGEINELKLYEQIAPNCDWLITTIHGKPIKGNLYNIEDIPLIMQCVKLSFMFQTRGYKKGCPEHVWIDDDGTEDIIEIDKIELVDDSVESNVFDKTPRYPYDPNSVSRKKILRGEGAKRIVIKTERVRGPARKEKLRKIEFIVCDCCGGQFEKHWGRYFAELFVEVDHIRDLCESSDEGFDLDVDNDLSVLCLSCHNIVTKRGENIDKNSALEYARVFTKEKVLRKYLMK